MFGEDMEGKYVSTMCGWPRQPLCLLRENGWKRSSRDHEPHHPGTTHLSEENKLQGTNKGLSRIFKSLLSVAPGFGVVRKQVP